MSADALAWSVAAVHRFSPIRKIRLTGGEPLVRSDLPEVVDKLAAAVPGAQIAVTTNGLLLADAAEPLRQAGVDAINVSLDSASAPRYRSITGGGQLARVVAGLRAAVDAGIRTLKINAVLLRSQNGDQLAELVRLARRFGAEMRFIERMPLGAVRNLYDADFLSAAEAISRLGAEFELLGPARGSGTASRYYFRDGADLFTVGLISPVSSPFCSDCDRLRLDSRGRLWTCLRGKFSVDLSDAVRTRDLPTAQRLVAAALARKSVRPQAWVRREMVTIGG